MKKFQVPGSKFKVEVLPGRALNFEPGTLHSVSRLVRLALLVFLALIAVGPALPAEAHANLVRSEPAANSVLPDSPPAVQLWFSEQPEPRFSEITIFTSTREQVKTSAVQVAPEDRLSLLVTLNPQQP